MSPRSLLLASLAAMGLACTSAPSTAPQGCLPGASLACACTDGRTGAQVCGDDGRLSPCVCTGGDASMTLPDATPSDVPPSVDAPQSIDAPPSVDAPVSPDAPVGVDLPASPDVPVGIDAPVSPDVPVRPDVPVSIDTPPIDAPIATTGNPFDGARMYVNPDYTRAVQMSVDLASASLRPTLACVGRYPTAIWIDRIAKVPDVTRHLDTALSEQTREGRPVVTTFVIYDLPGRDCAAHASNGELTISTADQARYRTEYIDRIAAAFRAHPGQRIAAIIEPDSLPNLATNLTVPACAAAQNAYREGVAYAVRTLSAPNVSLYLDAAHAGWLGWPDNRTRAASVYRSVLDAAGGVNLIRGFASNVSNYTVLREGPERFGWDSNPCHDETTFARLFGDALAAAGITRRDWIIDTSRNGRSNIRAQWGSWCNVQGAGLESVPCTRLRRASTRICGSSRRASLTARATAPPRATTTPAATPTPRREPPRRARGSTRIFSRSCRTRRPRWPRARRSPTRRSMRRPTRWSRPM
ncbi:MAG: glycoside hydrolase family 6 protein [Polyangiales bacterium]